METHRGADELSEVGYRPYWFGFAFAGAWQADPRLAHVPAHIGLRAFIDKTYHCGDDDPWEAPDWWCEEAVNDIIYGRLQLRLLHFQCQLQFKFQDHESSLFIPRKTARKALEKVAALLESGAAKRS